MQSLHNVTAKIGQDRKSDYRSAFALVAPDGRILAIRSSKKACYAAAWCAFGELTADLRAAGVTVQPCTVKVN